MAPLEIDNPFWRFSLRVYAAPGVAQECLEAQDTFGVDVNRLLYAVWLGATRGLVLDNVALRRIDEAVAAWSADVVQPLRSVRRGLKQNPWIADPEVQALRKRAADTELFAEQIEQALLYGLADAVGKASAESDAAAARKNVAAVLTSHGAEAGAFALPRLLAAVEADRQ